MNNTTVQRLKELNDQLLKLKNIKRRGEYKGAGISISLSVGQEPNESNAVRGIQLSVTNNTIDHESILEILERCITDSILFYRGQAEREIKELKELLK